MKNENEMLGVLGGLRRALLLSLSISFGLITAVGADDRHNHTPPTPHHSHGTAMTMDELHAHGRVPPGWRFSILAGDPVSGREVFVAMECYTCHEVKGEEFPLDSKSGVRHAGPELTGMGRYHPAEYFAESILNPNAVIVTGPGYTDSDGRSIMPDYCDSLTVRQLIDLVAYLKSLGSGK